MFESFDEPRYVIALIVLVGMGYGIWSFMEHASSQDPDWQELVRTSGLPPHRLNVWSEPYPPREGQIDIFIEFDFINLMNTQVDDLELMMRNDQGESFPSDTVNYLDSGSHKGRYKTSFQLPSPGSWELTVVSGLDGETSRVTFDMTVTN